MTAPGPLGDPPVRAVLFDYGMTLVTFRHPGDALERAYAEIREAVEARLGRPAPVAATLVEAVHDAVDAAVAEHERSGALEEIALSPVYDTAYRRLGLELPADLLDAVQRIEQRAWFEAMIVPPGTAEALQALRGRGLRLGICSNAPYHPEAMAEQLGHIGLRPLLDSATFSSGAGWRKPSPRIFELALAELREAAGSTVMVGDRLREDVDGAHGAGMRAVLLTAHRREAGGEGRADAVIGSLGDLVGLLA